jgi:hypothetical protein
MPADPRYLREHYASLSDEALRAIHRADLVETAQKCYDDEVRRRDLASRRDVRRETDAPDTVDNLAELDEELSGDLDDPGWLDEAAEVFSRYVRPGTLPADDIADARDALESAGIPCHLELYEDPEEKSTVPQSTTRWRLLVPGKLNQRATSVLERDIFNPEFESEWKTLLETLSDEDLRWMKPEIAFCGLFDRLERVTRAYAAEIARRRL